MQEPHIATDEDWLAARLKLLEKEKELSRLRDEVTKMRQALPWRKVDKEYEFEGPEGKIRLSELFGDHNQLIIYHFMFDPEWTEGCKSCSFLADHYNPLPVHLKHRDVKLVTVSRAPLTKLMAFQKRMGWSFEWVSSEGSDFNRDFHVLFTPEEMQDGTGYYNYRNGVSFPVSDAPGISVFARDSSGHIYHTYSSYARGLENFIGAYHFLDIVPKGRDEGSFSYGMEWLRHHDRYGDPTFVDPYAKPN